MTFSILPFTRGWLSGTACHRFLHYYDKTLWELDEEPTSEILESFGISPIHCMTFHGITLVELDGSKPLPDFPNSFECTSESNDICWNHIYDYLFVDGITMSEFYQLFAANDMTKLLSTSWHSENGVTVGDEFVTWQQIFMSLRGDEVAQTTITLSFRNKPVFDDDIEFMCRCIDGGSFYCSGNSICVVTNSPINNDEFIASIRGSVQSVSINDEVIWSVPRKIIRRARIKR